MSDDDTARDELSRNIEGAKRSPDAVEVRHALARARAQLLDRTEPVTLSRYVLLDKLGAGGRGVVYKAYDPALERQVAIKLLRPDITDEDDAVGRARLLREAQAIAQLAHPNVIAVHDVGTFDSSELSEPGGIDADQTGVFVVMEYVHGPTLGAWLGHSQRSWREIQSVFVAAGEGLAAAHDAGMIHRDFKPANVMVGDDGRVRVLDFGLARLESAGTPMESDSAEIPDSGPSATGNLDTPLTRHGVVMGTPAYMAPEQHRGKEIDGRTDQYSFCLALYEALAGRRPFPKTKKMKELIAAKLQGLGSDHRAPTGVPDALWRVVLRGLAPAPGDRYASMQALLAELSHDPHANRRRLAWALSGVAGIALAVATTNAWSDHEAGLCDEHGEQLRGAWDEQVSADAAKAFGNSGLPYAKDTWNFVRGQLDAYANEWVGRGVAVCEARRAGQGTEALHARQELCLDTRRAALTAMAADFVEPNEKTVEFAAQIASQLPSLEACAADSLKAIPTASLGEDRDTAIQIAQMLAQASSLYARQETLEAKRVASEVLERAEEVDDAGAQARALILLGRLDGLAGKPEAPHLYRAWELAESAGDARTTVEVLVELSRAVMKEPRRIEDADGLLRIAKVKLGALALDDPRLRARVANAEASIHFARRERQLGLRQAEQAMHILEGAVGPHHPELANFLILVAENKAATGDFTGAREAWEQAGRIVTQSLGPTHPLALFVLSGQAGLEWGQSNLDLAVEHGERCLETATAAYGPDHLLTAICADKLGQVLTARGDFERAIDMLRLSTRIEELRVPVEPRTLTLRLGHLAATLSTANRPQEALTVVDRVVQMQHEHFPSGHSNRNLGLEKRARIHFKLGHFDAALADYEEILRDSGQARFDAEPGLVAGMAEALLALGRNEPAKDLLEKALSAIKSLEPTDTRAADVRFAVARAVLVEQPVRARGLAELARKTYADKSTNNPAYKSIDAWLEQHFPADEARAVQPSRTDANAPTPK